jgi:hypothetical protein
VKLTAIRTAREWAWRIVFLLALLGPTTDFTFDGFLDVFEVNAGNAAASDYDDDWILARRPDEAPADSIRPDLSAASPWFPRLLIALPTRRDPSPTALQQSVRSAWHRALPRAHLRPELAKSSAAAADSPS